MFSFCTFCDTSNSVCRVHFYFLTVSRRQTVNHFVVIFSQNWLRKSAMVTVNYFLNGFGVVVTLYENLLEVSQFKLVDVSGF